ncbi:HNH endonuclease [Echinicola sp. 20G]|uniref:HNH endonuclease n=1 Tax=Echinicola sp. 20G TaxID=2781961 RepID=UPI0019109A4B|nr:HNH endonuclease signature motif containing protein [Echinicola sp. 20G]
MNKWNNKGWGYDTDFYRGSKWRKVRKQYIEENPICELCAQYDIVSEGEYVDHIIPRRFCKEMEYDKRNLQTLCGDCHNKKTALERGIDSLEVYLEEMREGRLKYICKSEKSIILIKVDGFYVNFAF